MYDIQSQTRNEDIRTGNNSLSLRLLFRRLPEYNNNKYAHNKKTNEARLTSKDSVYFDADVP